MGKTHDNIFLRVHEIIILKKGGKQYPENDENSSKLLESFTRIKNNKQEY